MTLFKTRDPSEPASDAYAALETVCLFVGYPRSGHSLIGSLLDAHPDVVIAHEANALKLVAVDGVTREGLFDALLLNAQQQAERTGGRRASGYSYAVPGQWQGRFRTLRVIGDKSGQKTANRVGRDPAALPAFERLVRVPVRLIHVTRNPYDTVARMALSRSSKGTPLQGAVGNAIGFLGRLSSAADDLISSGSYPVQVLRVKHESFVQHPQGELRGICDFVGVEAASSYLDACAGIVVRTPQEARHLISWSERDRQAVADLIARHAFLRDYGSSAGELVD